MPTFIQARVIVAVGLMAVLVVGFLVGHTAGWEAGRREVQVEAVHAGVATWQVTDASGSTTFAYLTK
jgi:hypothetical protein